MDADGGYFLYTDYKITHNSTALQKIKNLNNKGKVKGTLELQVVEVRATPIWNKCACATGTRGRHQQYLRGSVGPSLCRDQGSWRCSSFSEIGKTKLKKFTGNIGRAMTQVGVICVGHNIDVVYSVDSGCQTTIDITDIVNFRGLGWYRRRAKWGIRLSGKVQKP